MKYLINLQQQFRFVQGVPRPKGDRTGRVTVFTEEIRERGSQVSSHPAVYTRDQLLVMSCSQVLHARVRFQGARFLWLANPIYLYIFKKSFAP